MLRDLIRDDHDHARTKRHLATAAYGCSCRSDTCTHKRDVEDEIRRLIIEDHELIVADGRGYWRTDRDDELDRYEAWLEGKRESLSERLRAIRTARAARKAPDTTQTSWLDAA